MAQNRFANFVDIAAGREVHHRVGAVVYGRVQLLEFFVDLRGHCRIADVGIDLAQRRHADAHRLEFGMVDVGGNNHASAGDFVANQFGRKLFPVGDVSHFLGDHAIAGITHLGEIAVGILGSCDLRSIPPEVGGRCCPLLPLPGVPFVGVINYFFLMKYLSQIIRRMTGRSDAQPNASS